MGGIVSLFSFVFCSCVNEIQFFFQELTSEMVPGRILMVSMRNQLILKRSVIFIPRAWLFQRFSTSKCEIISVVV